MGEPHSTCSNEKWSSATYASTKLRKNHFFQFKSLAWHFRRHSTKHLKIAHMHCLPSWQSPGYRQGIANDLFRNNSQSACYQSPRGNPLVIGKASPRAFSETTHSQHVTKHLVAITHQPVNPRRVTGLASQLGHRPAFSANAHRLKQKNIVR